MRSRNCCPILDPRRASWRGAIGQRPIPEAETGRQARRGAPTSPGRARSPAQPGELLDAAAQPLAGRRRSRRRFAFAGAGQVRSCKRSVLQRQRGRGEEHSAGEPPPTGPSRRCNGATGAHGATPARERGEGATAPRAKPGARAARNEQRGRRGAAALHCRARGSLPPGRRPVIVRRPTRCAFAAASGAGRRASFASVPAQQRATAARSTDPRARAVRAIDERSRRGAQRTPAQRSRVQELDQEKRADVVQVARWAQQNVRAELCAQRPRCVVVEGTC